MTLRELIDQECNRVLDEICAARYIRKSDVLSHYRNPHLIKARRDVARTLFTNGFRKADIARLLHRNHSMIKYWVDDETRTRRRALADAYARKRRGTTAQQREALSSSGIERVAA